MQRLVAEIVALPPQVPEIVAPSADSLVRDLCDRRASLYQWNAGFDDGGRIANSAGIGMGMGMSVVAAGRARSLRLASLRAGTALVSAAALSMSVTDAIAACIVDPNGTVNCIVNTATTQTTNTNGATAASSAQIQEFSNGSNISGTIQAARTISGFGLELSLTSAGPNTIDVANNGTVTTNQPVNALLLRGNGGQVTYTGSGTVSNTGPANALAITNVGTGGITVTNNGPLSATANQGLFILSQSTGTVAINGSGTIFGGFNGVAVNANAAANINITGTGAITGGSGNGIFATTIGGNLLVATGSTISGGSIGVTAATSGNGTVTVTTGGAITGTSNFGIVTLAENGATTLNVGHNLTAGTEGIEANGSGGGVIDINHTAGTIAAGTIAIRAVQSGSGAIDISQTGGALNGTTNAVSASMTGSGNIIVSLTGGTVGNVSGNAIDTSATTGSTTINTGVAFTSTAGNAINAIAGSGNIAITNGSTITGATNAVFGSTSGVFDITNNGTLNGNVNVTGSNAASIFANSGIWNAGAANSSFSGSLNNTGTVNVQNGSAGQLLAFAGNYSGNGAYRVDVDAAGNADRLNVGGTANLTGGSVNAIFLPGAYVSHNYTIFSAAGGLGGTTFTGGLTTTALPSGFAASLSYTSTDVLLTLVASLGSGTNLGGGQRNVAGTINNYFNNGGALPPGFVTVFGLTGSALDNALTQLSGEAATGAQQGAFQLGNSYLSLLTDPFATSRVGASGAIGFAREPASAVPASVSSAFAAYTKAPPLAAYAPAWDIWGAAFGGANNTRGETTMVGSHDAHTRAGGVAAGADYRISPDALIGVSLAGGNIGWSLTGSGASGGGSSDAFLAGLYGKCSTGPAYLSGALTYANYRTSTSRTVTVAGLDQLKADYSARGFGGRVEGGYRLPVAYGSIIWTPYGAVQAQSFSTPSYGEVAVTGSNQFALNFLGSTATAYRGELGLRTDKVMPIDNASQLSLFGRFAYAHDEISNPAAAANFTALGFGAAPFTVYGARPSRDLALATAGVEWRLANGVSFLAKFDGEFGDRSQTYVATGRIRYTW